MLANPLRLLHRRDRVPRLDDSHRKQREPEPVRVNPSLFSSSTLVPGTCSSRMDRACLFSFYSSSRFTYTPPLCHGFYVCLHFFPVMYVCFSPCMGMNVVNVSSMCIRILPPFLGRGFFFSFICLCIYLSCMQLSWRMHLMSYHPSIYSHHRQNLMTTTDYYTFANMSSHLVENIEPDSFFLRSTRPKGWLHGRTEQDLNSVEIVLVSRCFFSIWD